MFRPCHRLARYSNPLFTAPPDFRGVAKRGVLNAERVQSDSGIVEQSTSCGSAAFWPGMVDHRF
jgi:hypothetical protein